MPQSDGGFHFDFSLSVLNHLGRNLYRNFITVLGEAISNAWDADAKHVWIVIDLENSILVIKDDGVGMTEDDFQDKFLRVGYSKRDDSSSGVSQGKRPFIGRKGIGKLALLSCADVVTIATKTSTSQYTGGLIDNHQLNEAIDKDKTTQEYQLGQLDLIALRGYTKNHNQGTILYFKGLKDGISNTVEYLRKAVALYFRFSLVDKDFKIYLNDQEITHNDLTELSSNTQFLWELNFNEDPFINTLKTIVLEQKQLLQIPNVSGFIASVHKPSHLKIFGTGGEKVGIDLFVNGRLRESNMLKHIPSAQLPENYVYGQVHYNALDNGTGDDRFTSSREGVLADDELFRELLRLLNGVLTDKNGIYDEWDAWRLKNKQDGNDDNTARKSRRDRASAKLMNETIEDFKKGSSDTAQTRIDTWFKDVSSDSEFNMSAYADCFISENLVRKYIDHKQLTVTAQDHINQVSKNRRVEIDKKHKGNLTIDIRSDDTDLSYLDTEPLIDIAEPTGRGDPDALHQDEKQFTPIRNAVMHTSLLTVEARTRMISIRDNIRGKIRNLLNGTS
ncbi:hypothetical protein AUK57_02190 [Candidatus Saccharibacteria bacterium CG2_30_41_52]|nr:MAG: hypothetical protein AUK57_02190 [Candidatus Saccharibacteria bacterium CG2_30_41_52]PJE66157.1 MAG: DNA mismatch repair protein [Candidatus Saccharibacteria bacterium CG10_big_fil_rev_8_21_14_0_10_41_32]